LAACRELNSRDNAEFAPSKTEFAGLKPKDDGLTACDTLEEAS